MTASDASLHLGDALDVLPTLEAGSIDAVVTDPPAGIGFMNKEWDTFPVRLREGEKSKSGRKTGDGRETNGVGFAHGFPGVDARHRDRFVAFISSVFAECLRVVKPGGYALVWAIPRTSHWTATALEDAGWEIRDRIAHIFGQGFPKGKGCLKPAVEDWWLCRKPGPKVLPLGIDECRIPGEVPQVTQGVTRRAADGQAVYGAGHDMRRAPQLSSPSPFGRWPANLVLDDSPEVAEAFAAFGEKTSGFMSAGTSKGGHATDHPESGWARESHKDYTVAADTYGDRGSAARFFYTAKASKADRGEGNTHPTVKPLALMEWLVKLVCPKGGKVLDPFAGSGTTLVAALRTWRLAVGIERDPDYFAIAERRIADARAGGGLFADPEPTPAREPERDLFDALGELKERRHDI